MLSSMYPAGLARTSVEHCAQRDLYVASRRTELVSPAAMDSKNWIGDKLLWSRSTCAWKHARVAATSPVSSMARQARSSGLADGSSMTGHGPTPPRMPSARTEPVEAMAVATAYGPPPDAPTTAKSPRWSCFASATVSRPTPSRLGMPFTAVEAPYPGRLTAMNRAPASTAAAWAHSPNTLVTGVPGW